MNKHTKKKRAYKRITPVDIAKYKAAEIVHRNGSAAIRELEPDMLSPHDRAWRIRKVSDSGNGLQYINDRLQQIAGDAVEELEELVHSEDEQVRTRNVHYVLDQVKGKAVSRNINLSGKLNIQSVLD